jgi:hypothetical protein
MSLFEIFKGFTEWSEARAVGTGAVLRYGSGSAY